MASLPSSALLDLERSGFAMPELRGSPEPFDPMEQPLDFAPETPAIASPASPSFLARLVMQGGVSFGRQPGALGALAGLLQGYLNTRGGIQAGQFKAQQIQEAEANRDQRSRAYLRNEMNRRLSEANRIYRERRRMDRAEAAARARTDQMVPLSDEDAAALGVAQVPQSQLPELLTEARQRRDRDGRVSRGASTRAPSIMVPVLGRDGVVRQVRGTSAQAAQATRFGPAWQDSVEARRRPAGGAPNPALDAGRTARTNKLLVQELTRQWRALARAADVEAYRALEARDLPAEVASDPDVRRHRAAAIAALRRAKKIE